MSRIDLYLNCSLLFRGGAGNKVERWGPPQTGPNSLNLGQGKLQALSSVS